MARDIEIFHDYFYVFSQFLTDAIWHRTPMASMASSIHSTMTPQSIKPDHTQAPYSNIMDGYFNHASQVWIIHPFAH